MAGGEGETERRRDAYACNNEGVLQAHTPSSSSTSSPTETTLWDRLSLRLQGKHMCVSPATQRELCPPSPVPGLLFRLLLYYNDYMCVTWLSGGPSLSLSPSYGAEATATSDNLGMWGVAGLLEIGWTDWHNIDSGHGTRHLGLGCHILRISSKLRLNCELLWRLHFPHYDERGSDKGERCVTDAHKKLELYWGF